MTADQKEGLAIQIEQYPPTLAEQLALRVKTLARDRPDAFAVVSGTNNFHQSVVVVTTLALPDVPSMLLELSHSKREDEVTDMLTVRSGVRTYYRLDIQYGPDVYEGYQAAKEVAERLVRSMPDDYSVRRKLLEKYTTRLGGSLAEVSDKWEESKLTVAQVNALLDQSQPQFPELDQPSISLRELWENMQNEGQQTPVTGLLGS